MALFRPAFGILIIGGKKFFPPDKGRREAAFSLPHESMAGFSKPALEPEPRN
jgi:hypothetical protein